MRYNSIHLCIWNQYTIHILFIWLTNTLHKQDLRYRGDLILIMLQIYTLSSRGLLYCLDQSNNTPEYKCSL